jgi:hypothetical protein
MEVFQIYESDKGGTGTGMIVPIPRLKLLDHISRSERRAYRKLTLKY